ncbi:glycosyltransferase family 2 protein [Cohnella herbarum]|uniref:Glycosyltransferase n=1 Tax=Cohnella herbarum TaxID=2728023 RepID=A0A7Z2VL00_9BACL|nr:glycosyltransferase family 2 protein [Cohnella herbarum]QJD85211.1 glycosyltransferase [Cohnella herbarum]
MLPKITIVTACYNSERYIEDTIRSVAKQTYPNIEYIIVDGYSKDRTLEIVDQHRGVISIVISEEDNGIYDAFNKGVQASTGEIVYFLGSDDYLADSDVIKDVVNFFIETNAVLVYGNVHLNEAPDANAPFRKIGRVYTVNDFKQGHMPHHAGVFVRRELFDEVGLFNTGYQISGDFDFVLRCFMNSSYTTRYFKRSINVFREGGVSSNIRTKRKSLSETFDIVNKHFGIDMSPTITNIMINEYYKRWLTQSILTNRDITAVLKEMGSNKVAVFGTLLLSTILVTDMKKQGIQVQVLLDNDPERQDYLVNGLHIYSPDWLIQHPGEYDAVLIAIESDSDQIVKQQLEQLLNSHKKTIITWKELIEKSYL